MCAVWYSCYTLSYHSLNTADVVTEQVFCMYGVPWFCLSVLCITTYQTALLCEMVYIVLYINLNFVLEVTPKKNTAQYYKTDVCGNCDIQSSAVQYISLYISVRQDTRQNTCTCPTTTTVHVFL